MSVDETIRNKNLSKEDKVLNHSMGFKILWTLSVIWWARSQKNAEAMSVEMFLAKKLKPSTKSVQYWKTTH